MERPKAIPNTSRSVLPTPTPRLGGTAQISLQGTPAPLLPLPTGPLEGMPHILCHGKADSTGWQDTSAQLMNTEVQ